MLIFPVWFLNIMVLGGLVLCVAGVAALVGFLIVDSRQKRIW